MKLDLSESRWTTIKSSVLGVHDVLQGENNNNTDTYSLCTEDTFDDSLCPQCPEEADIEEPGTPGTLEEPDVVLSEKSAIHCNAKENSGEDTGDTKDTSFDSGSVGLQSVIGTPPNGIHPIALKFMQENRKHLQACGWTPSELYRRNKTQGVIFAGIWSKDMLKVRVTAEGKITLEWINASGQLVKQTAKPDLKRGSCLNHCTKMNQTSVASTVLTSTDFIGGGTGSEIVSMRKSVCKESHIRK